MSDKIFDREGTQYPAQICFAFLSLCVAIRICSYTPWTNKGNVDHLNAWKFWDNFCFI